MKAENEKLLFTAQVAIICIHVFCNGSKDVMWKCLNCDDLVCDGCKLRHDRKHVVVKRKRERMICHSKCYMCSIYVDVLCFCQFCKIHLCDRCVFRHLSKANNCDHLIQEDIRNVKGPYVESEGFSDFLHTSDTSVYQGLRNAYFPQFELYSFHIFHERKIVIDQQSYTNLVQDHVFVPKDGSIFLKGRLVCPRMHGLSYEDCTLVCLSCGTSSCDKCQNEFHSMCKIVEMHKVTYFLKMKILVKNRLCQFRCEAARTKLQGFFEFLQQSEVDNSTFRLFFNVRKYEFIAQLKKNIDGTTDYLRRLIEYEHDFCKLCDNKQLFNMYYFESDAPFLKIYDNITKDLQKLEKCSLENMETNIRQVERFCPPTLTRWRPSQNRKKRTRRKGIEHEFQNFPSSRSV